MRNTFLKQLSSIHTNNLVILEVANKLKNTPLKVMTHNKIRLAFSKKERRNLVKQLN